MSERTRRSQWASERLGLWLLALLSGLLAALVVLPYLQYVLLAIVLAYVLVPAQRALEHYVGSTNAALSLVLGSVLVFMLPMMYVLTLAILQGLELVMAIQEGVLDAEAIEGRLEGEGFVVDLTDVYATYQEPIATGLQGLASSALGIVGGLPGVFIGLTVTAFVMFSLLRDGDNFLSWLVSVMPIDEDVQWELLVELDRLMWASVVGNVAVAAIQGILLGIGLVLLGIPGVAFLTVATFLLALLPLVGAFVVWVPISMYLVLSGQPIAGVTLFVYGALVSASDTYLRPAVIGRSGALSAAVVVVGIFGGVAIFGVMGLFVGPVVLGGVKVVFDVVSKHPAIAGPSEETTTLSDFS